MKNHEEDAHNALTEAIDSGGKLRMTIPANPATDTDLRIARALTELRDMTALLAKVKLVLDPNHNTENKSGVARAGLALTLIENYEEDNR